MTKLVVLALSCLVKLVLSATLSCLMPFAAFSQGQAQDRKAMTSGEAAAGTFAWGHGLTYVRDHFVKAAEEFPEDKYGYRPNEDTRSFAEIVMHVARYNHLNAAADLGRPEEDVSEFAFHSKAQAPNWPRARITGPFGDIVQHSGPDSYSPDKCTTADPSGAG